MPNILPYGSFIFSDRVYVISSAPEVSVPIFVLEVRMMVKIIKLLLLFKYPMNCDTLKCGGIATNK